MSTVSLNHLRVNESGTRLLHNIRDTPRAAEKNLFKSKRKPPAEKTWIAHVCPTKNGFKIVEEQLVGQVLNVKLEVHRHPFLLHQVRAHREIQNRSRTHPPSLKVDFVIQTRIEALGNEVCDCRPRLDVHRHAGIVTSAKARIQSGRTMVVTNLKLRFVALVMVVCELEAFQKQILRIFAQKQTARDRRYAKRSCIRIGDEGVEAVYVSRLEADLLACDSSRRDCDGKNNARFEKLILVREVLDPLLIDSQVQSEKLAEQLLCAGLERMLLVRQDWLNCRDSL